MSETAKNSPQYTWCIGQQVTVAGDIGEIVGFDLDASATDHAESGAYLTLRFPLQRAAASAPSLSDSAPAQASGSAGAPTQPRGCNAQESVFVAGANTSDLRQRLAKCRYIVAQLATEGRPPRMTIPAHRDNEDLYLFATLERVEEAFDRLEQALAENRVLAIYTPNALEIATTERPAATDIDIEFYPVRYRVLKEIGLPKYRIAGGIYVEECQSIAGSRYAVRMRGLMALSKDGEWSMEPSPSNRSNEWLDNHRWESIHHARTAATKAARKILAATERPSAQDDV